MEPDTMNRLPLRNQHQFLSFRQLSLSIIQGLFITAGCLEQGTILCKPEGNHYALWLSLRCCFSNILLTLVNRSFRYSIRQTIFYKNNLMYLILSITTIFIFLILNVPYLRGVFNLEMISLNQILLTFFVALIAVGWIEVWKLIEKNITNLYLLPSYYKLTEIIIYASVIVFLCLDIKQHCLNIETE